MTALEEFQRLEAPGIWRPHEDAQRRDVVVSFGDATLTITTGSDVAMSHWSLAAIHRLNPGARPALFAPAPDDPELLEIADETMVEAIEKVRRALSRAGPHPRRLRLVTTASLGLALVVLAVFWLPGAMGRYASSVVPQATRAEIGAQILAEINRLSGAPCSSALGDQALADLQVRLRPGTPGRIVVLRDGGAPSRHLPGGIILLNRSVVEDFEDPDVVAGFVLAEAQRIGQQDPLKEMLGRLGLGAAVKLLTTGDIGPAALARYAEQVLVADPDTVADDALLERFRAAAISSAPYAYGVDITGETTIRLIEADPVLPARARPVLDDGAWISLQGICGG